MRIPHGLRSALASQAAAPATDEYFSDVSLLLYGDGTNGSTAIVDSSSNGHAITVNGDAQISTAQSKFGGASIKFDGNDSVEVPSTTALSFGTGDFTIECWAYFNSLPSSMTVANFDGGGAYASIFFAHLPTLNCYISGNGTSWNVLAGNSLGTPSTGVWHHLALVREGNFYKGFLDGVLGFSVNNSSSPYGTSALARIGNASASLSQGIDGYIDDFRITKGVARYTANFTPPTASFSTVTPGEKYFYQNSLLLSADGTNGSTAIVDSSANAHTITVHGNAHISTTLSKFGGSALFFDGAGDLLSAPTDPSFEFGTGDFTVELWANINSLTAGNHQRAVFAVLGNGGVGGSNPIYKGWSLQYVPGTLIFGRYDGTSYAANFSTTFSLNTWYHIAVSRSGTSIRAFVNGTQVGSTLTDNVSYNKVNNDDFRVGYMQTGSGGNSHDFYHGYIDDLRITKGVARYTSNFTIPTSEASSTDPYFSNTKLLLNGNGTNGSTTFTDSSNSSHTVTASGNAQISTTQSKFGGASIYQPNAGSDIISISATGSDFEFTGDYTIEFWVYYTSRNSDTSLFITYNGYNYFAINISTTVFNIYLNSGTPTFSPNHGMSLNTWHHVAMCRLGSTVFIYVDGVVKGSFTSSATHGHSTPTYVRIGGPSTASGSAHYIDDLRITNGVARYGNFAVPTAGFSESSPILATQALIVAGGGSGNGGGGGAGGLLHYTALNVFKNTIYTITVGAGGDRANNGPLGWGGEHGGDSSIQAGATPITATGGGGGAAGAYTNGTNANSGHIGGAGGSGGGGGNNAAVTNVVMPGGSGIAGQGNAGGSRTAISGSPAAGGGGHAAAGGQAGGAGTAISIINTTTATSASVGHVSGGLVYFAGGGGGGSYNSGAIGGGGLGGGGVGRRIVDGYDSSQNGLAHTGGGGGGGLASDGGSGVVIFRFPQSSSYQATGTYSAYSESTDTIVIFKGTGTIKWT